MAKTPQTGFEGLSPLTRSLIEGMLPVQKTERRPAKDRINVQLADPWNTDLEALMGEKSKDEKPNLAKSILNVLNGPGASIERLAFESDPKENNAYASVFKSKIKLIPDTILKRIAIQDDLVASIVTARANQLASFGRPQPDRFSTGFKIIPDQGVLDKMSPQEKEAFEKRLDIAERKLTTCGSTDGIKEREKLTFSQYLSMSTRNAVTVGRLATEIVSGLNAKGESEFHRFRPIDAGTIYRTVTDHDAEAQSVRDEALHLLEQIKGKKLLAERFKKEDLSWVQVIDGQPLQAFTSKECLVHNFYPVTDVELDGYPVTPIDTAISAVTTHINITTHNKMYFQTGRATRGMLVIKSDDVGEDTVARIKQQFQASINSVSNAWRMPVFGIGSEDDIVWSPIDNGSRDMEFQYLSDSNARVILSAFQMSPEELPGYAHLSRGTNNQSLSESNNEYQLEGHRDLGIRPLISQFEDFINASIFPLIDPQLAKFCVVKLVGLDSETAEKESVRLQQDMPLHMTYDEVLEKVEKKPVGLQRGGSLPLNPQYLQHLDKYFTVGQILEWYCGVENASKDPALQYRRDPFYFQSEQMRMQKEQMQQQAQQAQAQAAQGQDPNQAQPGDEGQDLTRSLDQLIGTLSKSESQLPVSRRKLLAHQRKTVERLMEPLEADLKQFQIEAMELAQRFAPKHKKD